MAVTRSTAANARSEWIRMGIPPRARNCLGCDPAMRVPMPAAGKIANTCITCGVYIAVGGGYRWASRGGPSNCRALRREVDEIDLKCGGKSIGAPQQSEKWRVYSREANVCLQPESVRFFSTLVRFFRIAARSLLCFSS